MLLTICCWSGVAIALVPPPLVFGKSAARRAPTVASALLAWDSPVSAFSRATTITHCAPRDRGAMSRGVKISGSQNSVALGSFTSAGATPTIVNGLPSSCTVAPTASARPPNWRRHKPSLRTIDVRLRRLPVVGEEARGRATSASRGRRRSSSVTCAPRMRSGSPSPVRFENIGVKAAAPENAWLWAVKSW